jgi:SAM-dependent methyltransferase
VRPLKYTARTADKHELYELSVQNPEADVAFIERFFRKHRGRIPTRLREDFCGTAKLCGAWVQKPDRYAVGIDIDSETLALARARNVPDKKRVKLVCNNVRKVQRGEFDVACAFNFSYFVFKTREGLRDYFRAVRKSLKKDGVFFLDTHGGTETYSELEETTRHKGFTYVWQQAPYDAVTGYAMRYIHFRFPDGTQLRRAFEYDWRMWTLPEVKDILMDAGFRKVEVYWEGSTPKGAGNGIFKKVAHAENEAAWVAYITAES